MKDQVSIALTTYNGERFLRPQLDSIFAQTHKNIEVVAVDDCSTDGTVAILKEYRAKHPLRYFVNEARVGFVKNFERAISKCDGDYVALADQDDIWVPTKIEILISRIQGKSLACSDFGMIDEEGRILAASYRASLDVPIPDPELQFYSLVFINFVNGCTCLFRREFKEQFLPIPVEAMSHDWWMGVCATQSGGIEYVNQPLVLYRQHERNTIGARELWKISGKLRYAFSSARKEVMLKERARIQYYMNHNVYSDKAQEDLLRDLYEHYDSIARTRIHARAFAIAFRRRHHLLPNISQFSRWMYMLGRLV